MVLALNIKIVNYGRFLEWKALLDWAQEQVGSDPYGKGKLGSHERVRAINWTLQRHWQEATIEVPDNF